MGETIEERYARYCRVCQRAFKSPLPFEEWKKWHGFK